MSYFTPNLPSQLSYKEAVDLTMQLIDFERGKYNPSHSLFHLERMEYLMGLIENPHLKIPSIHIAGTKGKGSVAAMISSILIESNFNVGLTTSPHLYSLRERINIDGINISKIDFTDIVKYLWPYVIQVEKESEYGQITWFEFIVAAAFTYFYDKHVDSQVVETGLGGRLDATNIVIPEVSVITSISLDHTKILGDSIEEIANEKSGIIKNNIPIILAPQYYESEVISVVGDIAHSKDASFVNVNNVYKYDIESTSIEGQVINVYGKYFKYKFLLPLLGLYQPENAVTAIATVEALLGKGLDIGKEDIEKGLEKVLWPARMEIFNTSNKSIIIDGAHNEFSAKKLTETLLSYRENILKEYSSQVIIVFGILNNHDCTNILNELTFLNPLLVPVKSMHPKSVDVKDIFDSAMELGISTIDYSIELTGVSEAMEYVTSIYKNKEIILATGSISVAAEALQWYKE